MVGVSRMRQKSPTADLDGRCILPGMEGHILPLTRKKSKDLTKLPRTTTPEMDLI
jgi:hypothetical protein